MSYDNDEYMGAFTESERSCGIPDLMFGYDREENCKLHLSSKERSREEIQELRVSLAKRIAHLETVKEVQAKVFKTIQQENISDAIRCYAAAEKLPIECINLVKQNNALPILLKGFMRKLYKGRVSHTVYSEIESFCKKAYRNEELKIVYDRVGDIQKFVHTLVNEVSGEGADNLLPSGAMKNLLSAARLHLNLLDIKVGDPHYVRIIFNKSANASDSEKKNPRKAYIPMGKKYIKNWSVLQLMPITQYQNNESLRRTKALFLVDNSLPINEYKNEMLKIYSDNEYSDEKIVPYQDYWDEDYCEDSAWSRTTRWL